MTKTEITQILSEIEPKHQQVAKKIFTELEFIQKVLTDLKKEIKQNGIVDHTAKIARESPAIKSYNQTVKSYSYLLKQLETILRKDKKIEKSKLQEWLDEQQGS